MEGNMSLAPEHHSSLPTFEQAVPLGDSDEAFVAELRHLLAKYDNLDRFGLALLHDHFDIAPDEILFETNNPQHRTLSLTTEKIASLPPYKATMWHLNPSRGAVPQALQACAEDHCKGAAPQALQACAEDHCK
jgi:hypothetical protein